jgi:hypothetical protein
MKRIVLVTLAALTAVMVAAAALAAVRRGPDPAVARVSNPGVALAAGTLESHSAEMLSNAGANAGLRELASRGGTTFFVAPSAAAGRLCFATGHGGAHVALDLVACQGVEGTFPSAGTPIVDVSPRFSNDPQDASKEIVNVVRLAGYASDGVASVAVVGVDGSVRSTPVRDNVYASGTLPRIPAKAIVAFDSAGATLATIPLVAG